MPVPDAPDGVKLLDDTPRYKHRFDIPSESSDAKHRVSWDVSAGAWICSCRGQIRHGYCKHLRDMELYPMRNDRKGNKIWDDDYRPYGTSKEKGSKEVWKKSLRKVRGEKEVNDRRTKMKGKSRGSRNIVLDD
jgi:hypothetical protein